MSISWLNWGNTVKMAKAIGMQDWADKLNSVTTVYMYIGIAVIATTHEYLFSPIECYFPTVPSGKNFEKFTTQLCFVTGTVAILPGEPIPQNDAQWEAAKRDYKIVYYQWIPFILGLQCLMYYIPYLIWQAFCYNRSGTDLENLVNAANSAEGKSGDSRVAAVNDIARNLEDIFYKHRNYSAGQRAKMKRGIYNKLNFIIPSKRLGNNILIGYLLIKVLYVINAISQIYIIRKLLDLDKNAHLLEGLSFGGKIAKDLLSGRSWRDSRLFPRVTFCHYPSLRHLGATNQFTGQCTLPTNMIYEKIYMFLWFWTVFVAVATAVSIPIWFVRMGVQTNRNRSLKKYLKVSEALDYTFTKDRLRNFDLAFLRLDGAFLIDMIARNAGDLVATEIVTALWKIFVERYEGQRDFRKDIRGPPPSHHGTGGANSLTGDESVDSNLPPAVDDEKKPIAPSPQGVQPPPLPPKVADNNYLI